MDWYNEEDTGKEIISLSVIIQLCLNYHIRLSLYHSLFSYSMWHGIISITCNDAIVMKLIAQRLSIHTTPMTVSPSGRQFCLCLPVIAPVKRQYVAKASVRQKFLVISSSLFSPHASIWCCHYMHPMQHLPSGIQSIFFFFQRESGLLLHFNSI